MARNRWHCGFIGIVRFRRNKKDDELIHLSHLLWSNTINLHLFSCTPPPTFAARMDSTGLFSKLKLLEGSWTGKGAGQFPTIPSFTYDETTRFSIDHGRKIILYEQKTFLTEEQRNSHWETGFILLDETTSVKLKVNNVQSGGRVELMEGWFETDKLILESIQFFNDQRMISSKRIWQWTDTVFSYEMYMHTSATEKQLIHLSASLTKDKT